MVPQNTSQEACDRVEARRHRAETSVPWGTYMSANQLWKCARALQALAPLALTAEQRAVLEARAERAEGLAWDKALRHQVSHAHLPQRLLG